MSARSQAPPPGAQLSVVLVTDGLGTIADVLDALRSQTAQAAIELVVVVPEGTDLDSSVPALQDFASVRSVELPSLAPIAAARAAGVRAATAPLVFVGETHAFPGPEFAETVIRAHEDGIVAVVPVIENANPESALSWANHLLNYAPWIAPGRRADLEHAPAYLTTYRRELLAPMVDLAQMLDGGAGLDERLRATGGRIVLEPAARVAHLHVSRPRSWVADRYLATRVFSASRSARWSRRRRIAYCFFAPAMPVVYVGRTLWTTGWWQRRRELPRGTLPAVVAGALVSTCGEVMGCAAGAGTAPSRVLDLELHRERHLR